MPEIHFEPARSGFEKVGNALALVLEGIPMGEPMWDEIKRIYGVPLGEDKRPKVFSYVDLATDEIALDPNRPDSDLLTSNEVGYLSYLARSPFYRYFPKATKDRETYLGYKRSYIKSAHGQDSFYSAHIRDERLMLSPEGQPKGLKLALTRLSSGYINDHYSEDPNIVKAIQAICANPEKPFLIIHGHGGHRYTLKGRKMIIGESDGNHWEDLEKVFRHMEVEKDKYSLVILHRCNSAGLTPEKFRGKTPILQTIGNAGILSERESQFIE